MNTRQFLKHLLLMISIVVNVSIDDERRHGDERTAWSSQLLCTSLTLFHDAVPDLLGSTRFGSRLTVVPSFLVDERICETAGMTYDT